MIRAIFRKEWREHRSKYIVYWLAIHAPMVLLILGIAFSGYARIPFADLSDANAMKYLPLALIQPLLSVTLFLILTGYLAVATFGPEVDDRSLFFVFEQPVSRRYYLAIKFLHGACHVVLATCCAILLLPLVSYAMMLASGKVTAAGSSAAFSLVMGGAARSAVWCSLIALAGFAASTLVSALVPRWWLAAACSVVLTVVLIAEAPDYFNFLPDNINDNSMSIGMGFGTGNSPWITISRALTVPELAAYAPWRLRPLLTALLLIMAFFAATTLLYDRKELK